jgi:CRP/FNR family transcriptional regulator, anaerobic regulatory protein
MSTRFPACRRMQRMEFASIDDLPELRALPVLSFPAGHLLFDESHSCLGFPLLSQGSIKVSKSFPNGRELLLYHIAPGETCVVSASCLFSGLRYTASAMTRSDVKMKLITPGLFEQLMAAVPFRRFVMWQFTQRLTDLMALVDAIFTHRLDQRLAARLLAHGAENGGVFATTHQQLADELGSIREVVSRLLKHFSDEGWISIERGAIHILAPEPMKKFAAAPG